MVSGEKTKTDQDKPPTFKYKKFHFLKIFWKKSIKRSYFNEKRLKKAKKWLKT